MKNRFCFFIMAIVMALGGFAQGNLVTLNESFEDGLPDDWVSIGMSRSAKESSDGDYSMYRNVYSSNTATLITPQLVPQTGESIKFHLLVTDCGNGYDGPTDESLIAVTAIDEEGNEDTLLSQSAMDLFEEGDWHEFEVSLADYVGQKVNVKFYTEPNGGDFCIYIDEVSGVSYYEVTCFALGSYTNISKKVTGSTTATLYWTDPNAAGSYEVRYVKTNGVLSYSQNPDWTDPSVKTVIVNDTFADLTDLEAGSVYYYAVRVLCPDGNPTATAWTTDYYSTTYFTMPPADIEPTDLPYSEDFETDMGKWFVYVPAGSYPMRYSYSGHNAPACVYGSLYGASSAQGAIFGTSNINEDLSKLRFRFWAKNSNASSGALYILGQMTDPYDTTTFVPIDTLKFTNTYKLYDYSFENYEQVSGTGHLVFWLKGGSNYDYFYFDDAEIMYEPDCKGPVSSSLVLKEADSESATITWEDNHESTTEWTVIVYPIPSGDAMEYTANDKEYTISGLDEGSTYLVTVKAKCGSEYSLDTCDGILVHTVSEYVAQLPYENTFETAEEQAQFTIFADKASNPNQFMIISDGVEDEDDPYAEKHSLGVSSDYGQSNTLKEGQTYAYPYTYAALNIDFGDIENAEISFDAKAPRTNYGVDIYLVDKGTDLSSDANITAGKNIIRRFDNSSTILYGISDWQHFRFPISATGEKILVFRFRDYDYYYYGTGGFMVDNIQIKEACPMVTGLAVTNTKHNDLTISWNATDAESYNVYYVNIDDESATSYNTVNVTGNSLTFSQKGITLAEDAHYEIYVEGICGEGDTSIFSDFVYPVTPCNATIATLPYTLAPSVDSYNANQECVTVVSNYYYSYYNAFYPYVRASLTNYHENDDGEWVYDTVNPFFDFSSVSGNGYEYLVLPELASDIDMSKIKLTTDMWSSSYTKEDAYLEVGVMTDPNDISSFVLVDKIGADETSPKYYSGDTNWTTNRVYFDLYQGTGRYIAIRGAKNSSKLYDVVIDYTTDCEPPMMATVEETATTSADISWQRLNENSTNFTVYYKAKSDTAYQTLPVTFTGTGSKVTTTITGLKAGTAYVFYVKGNCSGGEETEPSNIVNFLTECGNIMALPYALNLTNDYYITSELADGTQTESIYCWSFLYSISPYSTGSTYKDAYPDLYVYNNNNNYVSFKVGYSGYYEDLDANDQYMISPKVDESIPMNTIQVQLNPSVSLMSSSKFSGFEIGVMSDPTDKSTFETVVTVDTASIAKYNSTVPDPMILTLDSYTGTGRYIAMRLANPDSVSDVTLYVYGFEIQEIDPCVAPLQLKVQKTTQDSVYFTFKPLLDDQTNFVAHYIAVGGYDSQNPTEQTVNITYTPNTVYSIGGLSMATQYKLWVTTDCENAPVRQKVLISTKAKVMDFPYTSSFDATNESDVMWTLTANDSNAWYIGAQAGHNSLYLSKNGVDTLYAQTVAGYETALLQLNMNECDSVEVEFDITLGGSTTFDFLKVLFTPDSIEYASSENNSDISAYESKWAMNFKKALFSDNDTLKLNPTSNQYYISLPYESKYFNQSGNRLPKEGINTFYHVKTRMVNPAKNGVGNFMFIFRNDKVEEYCWQAPVIRNFSITEVVPPAFAVTTDSATLISDKSATLYATMDVDTQFTVAAKGFEYKASAATDYTVIDVIGDNFVHTLNGLTPETEYTFRAFIAKNITDSTFDTVYGEELTFTTLEEQEVIIDPAVQTASPSAVWTDAATLVANVTLGTKDITEYGFESRLATESDDNYKPTIATANGTTFTATLTGLEVNTMYTIRGYVKTEDGTFYGNVITFATSDTSSLTEVMKATLTISMYPNPTSDNATLTVNGLNSTAKVILTDVQGRVINESELPMGENTMTINTSNLESGVYYVRVMANGVLRTEKLIKK